MYFQSYKDLLIKVVSLVYPDITLYSLFIYCKADYDKKLAIIGLGGRLYRH